MFDQRLLKGGPLVVGRLDDHQVFTPWQGTTTPQSLIGTIGPYLWFFRLLQRRHDLGVRSRSGPFEVLQFVPQRTQHIGYAEGGGRRDDISILVGRCADDQLIPQGVDHVIPHAVLGVMVPSVTSVVSSDSVELGLGFVGGDGLHRLVSCRRPHP